VATRAGFPGRTPRRHGQGAGRLLLRLIHLGLGLGDFLLEPLDVAQILGNTILELLDFLR
jgi:hypothetical protein